MKAFVYNKTTSERIAVLENVISVLHLDKSIIIKFDGGTRSESFNTKEVKTRIYQN